MKKKISLVLAVLMAVTMLGGCKKTEEKTDGLPEAATSSLPELTQMTFAEAEETTIPEVTVTAEETTTATEVEVIENETEATTISAEADETKPSETEASETEASETTTAKPTEWTETEISETLYVVTNCYSRVKAVVGSESVKQYKAGTEINIVAATDTGYYKLADGTFIHSDYVSDQKPSSAAKVEDDDDDSSSEKKPSSKPSKISSSYNKNYEDRYPYQQLSSSEKKLYRNIVEAAYAFDPNVEVPDGLLYEDIFKVYSMVFSQEPQLFWLPSAAPKGYGTVTIDYAFTQSEVESIQKEIDATAKEVMSVVGGYSGTISRLKAIYDWVVTNNYNEVGGSIGTLGVYNGLTGRGSLQCQGYAKTFQYLCDMAGIDCMVVTGNNAEGSSHAWNIVYCDNGYYIVDTTWGDPRTDYGKSSYVRYLFFLTNDASTADTHVNVSTMYINSLDKRIKIYNPPACTKTACYYFNAYEKTFDSESSAYNGMCAEIKAAVKAGKNVAHIRVTNHDLWETMRSDSYWKKYQEYAKSLSSNVDKLKRQTTLTEDVLVVQFDIVYK